MKKMVGCLLLLLVVALTIAPAFAAELRVTGFIDNVFPRWESNSSGDDNDPSVSTDQATFGRARMRNFFNFIANDNLRGVFAIEIDQIYGAPSDTGRGGGACDSLSFASSKIVISACRSSTRGIATPQRLLVHQPLFSRRHLYARLNSRSAQSRALRNR